jgi:hypothetical protein
MDNQLLQYDLRLISACALGRECVAYKVLQGNYLKPS